MFFYAENLYIKIGCDMQFEEYPFDQHNCPIKMFSPDYDINRLQFDQLNIVDYKSKKYAHDELLLETDRVPFEVKAQTEVTMENLQCLSKT